jgi:aminoglycoside phosphotransferase (APT) family kinase protein
MPEELAPLMSLALGEVERLGPQYLSPAAPCRARLVSVSRRSHSLIGVIELLGPKGSRRFFVKTLRTNPENLALKRRQLEREFSLLEELALRFEPHPRMSVIRPVRGWPEHVSMLTEEFRGETLERFLSHARRFPTPRATKRSAALCYRVGRWLALFQGFTKPPDSTLFDPSDLVRYCERRLRILADAESRHPAYRAPADLLRRAEGLAAAVEPAECLQVGRQNDFRPDNILTDGESVAVLDFTGFTYGPPLYDFMKFQMKLEDLVRGFMLRPRAVEAWQTAFAEGYGTAVDLRSPLARLLRIANILDKMSELALGDVMDPSASPRRRQVAHYRARLADLETALKGMDTR